VTVIKEGNIIIKTDHEFESEAVLIPKANKEGFNIDLCFYTIGKEIRSTIDYLQIDFIMKVAELWNWPFMVPELETDRDDYKYLRIVKIVDLYDPLFKAYDVKNAPDDCFKVYLFKY